MILRRRYIENRHVVLAACAVVAAVCLVWMFSRYLALVGDAKAVLDEIRNDDGVEVYLLYGYGGMDEDDALALDESDVQRFEELMSAVDPIAPERDMSEVDGWNDDMFKVVLSDGSARYVMCSGSTLRVDAHTIPVDPYPGGDLNTFYFTMLKNYYDEVPFPSELGGSD